MDFLAHTDTAFLDLESGLALYHTPFEREVVTNLWSPSLSSKDALNQETILFGDFLQLRDFSRDSVFKATYGILSVFPLGGERGSGAEDRF